jgi:hypothetical protein
VGCRFSVSGGVKAMVHTVVRSYRADCEIPKVHENGESYAGSLLSILVDSGSSYNFIAVTVVEKLPRASKYSHLLHVTWEILSGVSKYSFLSSSRHPVMHFVFMVCTSLCMGSPLDINRSKILSSERFCLLLPTVVFHIVSFIAGYWIFKLLQWRQEEPVCRTISVCTGLQSSTLAELLDEEYGVGNRKCAKPNDGQADQQPIDDILQWQHDIAETRRMQQSANFSDILLFNGRLQFVADVCIFHSIAEDQVVFPSVESELWSQF